MIISQRGEISHLTFICLPHASISYHGPSEDVRVFFFYPSDQRLCRALPYGWSKSPHLRLFFSFFFLVQYVPEGIRYSIAPLSPSLWCYFGIWWFIVVLQLFYSRFFRSVYSAHAFCIHLTWGVKEEGHGFSPGSNSGLSRRLQGHKKDLQRELQLLELLL